MGENKRQGIKAEQKAWKSGGTHNSGHLAPIWPNPHIMNIQPHIIIGQTRPQSAGNTGSGISVLELRWVVICVDWFLDEEEEEEVVVPRA